MVDAETIVWNWQKVETIDEARQKTGAVLEEEEKQMRKMYMNIHRAILFPSWEIKTDLKINKIANK